MAEEDAKAVKAEIHKENKLEQREKLAQGEAEEMKEEMHEESNEAQGNAEV